MGVERRRARHRGWKLAAGVAAAAMAALATTSAWLLRDPEPHFVERRSALAAVDAAPGITLDGARLQTVRLVATSGLTVSLTTRREVSDGTRPLPIVVVLGGHVTGADAAKLVGRAPGVLVAAVSYPYDGDPRPGTLTFLRQIPAIRRAFLDTPPALSLALDYLVTLPDVDITRVEAVGVSLGAPFMTIAAARDARFTRLWVLHGSGGSYAPLEASMRRTIGLAPLRAAAAGIATVIICGPRIAPERWVARVAPRPFIMINARDDERLPRAAVDALYDRARAPKERIWMPGAHVHGDQPTIQALVRLVLERVAAPAIVTQAP